MNEPYRHDLNLVLPLGWGGLSLDLPVRSWLVLHFLSQRQPWSFRECATTPDGSALEVAIRADSAGIVVTRAIDYRGPGRRSSPRPQLQRRLSWAALKPLLLGSEMTVPLLPNLTWEFALLGCRPVYDEPERLRRLVGLCAGIGTLRNVSAAKDARDVTLVEELLEFDTLDMLLFRTHKLVMELAADLPVDKLQAEYGELYTPEAWAKPFPDWLGSALTTVTALCQRDLQVASESNSERRCLLMAQLLFQLDGFADQEGLTDRLYGNLTQPVGLALLA